MGNTRKFDGDYYDMVNPDAAFEYFFGPDSTKREVDRLEGVHRARNHGSGEDCHPAYGCNGPDDEIAFLREEIAEKDAEIGRIKATLADVAKIHQRKMGYNLCAGCGHKFPCATTVVTVAEK